MLCADLMIPLVMVVIGLYYSKHSAGSINYLCGYRTSMSMKNEDTWRFANRHWGKSCLAVGLALLPCSAVPMLLVMGRDEDTVALWGGVVCCVQVVAILASIIPTERALRRMFDENGNRR